jgi:hypothetical protein
VTTGSPGEGAAGAGGAGRRRLGRGGRREDVNEPGRSQRQASRSSPS